MDTINILSIIAIAFFGSFGHCIGMCGGIIIAYSSTKIKETDSKKRQATAHILYSLGRIFTYTILGLLFGYIGGVALLSNNTNGSMLIFAGLIMILTGLSLSGKIKFLTLVEHSISKQGWYSKAFKSLIHKQTLGSFFILGMLNGLLPCGLVYFFAVTAASTGRAFWGAMVMLIFGISTVPALFSLGFFVGLFKMGGFRNTMIKISALSVILFGIYTIYQGYQYIKYPQKTVGMCCEFDPNKINKRIPQH
jgi:sulfite exporter TauE/SafE